MNFLGLILLVQRYYHILTLAITKYYENHILIYTFFIK